MAVLLINSSLTRDLAVSPLQEASSVQALMLNMCEQSELLSCP